MTHRKRFSKRHNFIRKIGGAKKKVPEEQAPIDSLASFKAKPVRLDDTESKKRTEDVDAPLKSVPDKSIPGRQIYRGLTTVRATNKEPSKTASSSTVKD